MVFTTEGSFAVAIKSWPEWSLCIHVCAFMCTCEYVCVCARACVFFPVVAKLKTLLKSIF